MPEEQKGSRVRRHDGGGVKCASGGVREVISQEIVKMLRSEWKLMDRRCVDTYPQGRRKASLRELPKDMPFVYLMQVLYSLRLYTPDCNIGAECRWVNIISWSSKRSTIDHTFVPRPVFVDFKQA